MAMTNFSIIKNVMGIGEYKTNEQLQKEFSETFFYANVCQYCSKFQIDAKVKRCSVCHGMFYCSREHQVAHYKEHKEFCNALKSARLLSNSEYLFQNVRENKMAARIDVMGVTELYMKRKLKPYERNMFVFPRICITCGEGNPNLVKSCSECPHENFCVLHMENNVHKKSCKFFIFAFYLDHYWLVFKDLPIEDFIKVFPRNSQAVDLPDSMEEFIDIYMTPYHKTINMAIPEVRMLISNMLTNSLTLIYILQKLKLTNCNQLLVHVMCKKNFEKINFNEWEFLLHWFPKLKYLKIVYIGSPEATGQIKPELCFTCTKMKRSLKIETTTLVYNEYYLKTPRIPDVIIAYNVDQMTYHTWYEASELLTDLDCPIVLTSLDPQELILGVLNCVKDSHKFSELEKNPFRSLRPERSYHDVVYSNFVLSIYGNLFPKINDVVLNDSPMVNIQELETIEDVESELISTLEQKNFLLKQKLTILKDKIEKKKLHNDQTLALFNEFLEISNKVYNLEDRIYQHFEL